MAVTRTFGSANSSVAPPTAKAVKLRRPVLRMRSNLNCMVLTVSLERR